MNKQSHSRYFVTVAITLLMLSASAFASQEDQNPTQVAERLHEALNDGNKDDIFEVLAPDVLIYESGGVESSREEYASHHMHSDMRFMASMTREVISRKVTQEGGLAVVTTQSRISGSYDGKDLDLNSTETLMMTKKENGWQISHIHWSSKERK